MGGLAPTTSLALVLLSRGGGGGSRTGRDLRLYVCAIHEGTAPRPCEGPGKTQNAPRFLRGIQAPAVNAVVLCHGIPARNPELRGRSSPRLPPARPLRAREVEGRT